MLASSKMCRSRAGPSAAPVIVTGSVGRRRFSAVSNLPAAIENIGKQVAELDVVIAVGRRRWQSGTGSRCHCRDWFSAFRRSQTSPTLVAGFTRCVRRPAAQSCRIETA